MNFEDEELAYIARQKAEEEAYRIEKTEKRTVYDDEVALIQQHIYDEAMDKIKREKLEAKLDKFPRRYRNAHFNDYICENERMRRVAAFMQEGKSAVIYGANGTGKTLLAFCSIRHQLEQEKNAAYLLAADFFDEIRHSFGGGDSLAVLAKYAKLDYLVVDEVDKTHGSQTEFIYLYRLVNMRYSDLLPTVIIGNSETKDDLYEVIGSSAITRIASEGMIIEMNGKDWRKASA